MNGDETRKEFISLTPTQEKQWTNIPKAISKALKILVGLYKENVGQRPVGMSRWAVNVRPIIVLGSIKWSLAGVRTVLITLRGLFWFPSQAASPAESFACVISKISREEELNQKIHVEVAFRQQA